MLCWHLKNRKNVYNEINGNKGNILCVRAEIVETWNKSEIKKRNSEEEKNAEENVFNVHSLNNNC